MNNLRKSLVLALVVALFASACSSKESSGGDAAQPADDNAAEEPATESGPPEGFRRFTFEFTPEDLIRDVYQGDPTTFEVRSDSNSDSVVIGFLDDTGTIDIPIELARGTIGVEAEFPDDEFCWWSGFHTSIDSAAIVTIEVELEEICA